MPLRKRILLVTVALFLVGLAAVTLTTYHFVSSSLVGRLDDQLKAATGPVTNTLTRTPTRHPRAHGGAFLPTGSYAAIFDNRGRVRSDARFAFDEGVPQPRIPSNLIDATVQVGKPTLTTTPAVSGTTDYRLLAERLSAQETLIVAAPLTEVNATKRRVLVVGGAVSGFVLIAIGVAAYWLTRRELRPLERMARKSRQIAGGDLSQRVEPDDSRTEVGQLGEALNAMLAEIERAFADRVAAEEQLRRFVADASHELRTPVTSIRGYAEMFRRGAGDRPVDLAKVMLRIEQEGERMGELVEELLLLAQLDQGRPLDRQRVDLSALLEVAVDAARAADPERTIDIQSEHRLLIQGDKSRLRQVVDNLLRNARVHTPAGTPIHVRLAAEGEQVVLDVADEGPGVPAEEADRIFERFYRTDRARTRSRGGVGLGLPIVRSLVEAHGGAVGYRARPGGGSVFRVVLPLAPAASVRGAATASAQQPRRG